MIVISKTGTGVDVSLAGCRRNTRKSQIGPRKPLNSDVDLPRPGAICDLRAF